jgi:hypothetical protein
MKWLFGFITLTTFAGSVLLRFCLNIVEWRGNCIKIDYQSFDSVLFLCKLCENEREMFWRMKKNVIGFLIEPKLSMGRLVTMLECLFLSPFGVINSTFYHSCPTTLCFVRMVFPDFSIAYPPSILRFKLFVGVQYLSVDGKAIMDLV